VVLFWEELTNFHFSLENENEYRSGVLRPEVKRDLIVLANLFPVFAVWIALLVLSTLVFVFEVKKWIVKFVVNTFDTIGKTFMYRLNSLIVKRIQSEMYSMAEY